MTLQRVEAAGPAGVRAAAERPAGRARPAGRVAWPRLIRQFHLYLGVLFAPALLFFAFTGAMQVLNLHKPTPAYAAPAWVVRLAAVHKRQTLAPKADDPAPAGGKHHGRAAHADGPPAPAPAPKLSAILLKAYALAVSAGLLASTVSGLYLALRFSRRPRVVLALAGAGLAAPALLLLM